MKLCVPAIGSMIKLTEDWTIKVDTSSGYYWYNQFTALKDCKKIGKAGYRNNEYFEIENNQNITLPKDTILMIDNITMYKPAAKNRRHYKRHDTMTFSIVETSLEYNVDSENIMTPTGRVSKKKKNRPKIHFYTTPEDFNKIEFEFTF